MSSRAATTTSTTANSADLPIFWPLDPNCRPEPRRPKVEKRLCPGSREAQSRAAPRRSAKRKAGWTGRFEATINRPLGRPLGRSRDAQVAQLVEHATEN